MKLEVSGPAGDDADHGRVRVTPRDFRTKISPAQKVDVDVSSADGGRNRCAHDPIGGSNSHFLHRTNEGFEVRRVDDPDGPFAGAFFVASTDLELTRREEREIAYRGPSGAYFVGTGAPFNAQLQSQIEKHEAAHSDLMRDALERLRRQKRDPAQVMEKMASPDETRLRAAAGQAYFQTNREICQATQHPFVFRKLAELANVSGTIRDGSGNVIAIVSDLQTFANDDFTCD